MDETIKDWGEVVKQKMSKGMNMQFHWIRDRIQQNQCNVYWKPGPTNKGDYHSKHHLEAHHIQERSTNLYVPSTF